MNEKLWAQRPRPATGPGAAALGAWDPVTAGEVTAARRQLATALRDGARPAAATDSAVDGALERLLLCHEELASNAVRHGHPPVHVEVLAGPGWWLVEVSDAAPHAPPRPATGRDPAHGGRGLHLVARVCAAHGWYARQGRKRVWALIQHESAEEAMTGGAR